jgi:glycosyltransferase involved in cell wall biosynthesis
MNPLKIVIAADLSPRKLGSLERSLFGVAKRLRQQGHSVRCLFSGPISDEVRAYFDIQESEVVTSLGELATKDAHTRWLEQFRKERADVVWLHFFPLSGLLPIRIRLACHTAKIICTERVSRGYPPKNTLRSVLRRIKNFPSRYCVNQCIAISNFVARRLEEVDRLPSNKISIVYNGIDVENFFPKQKINTEEYILAAGYLRPEKGIDVLLDALYLLKLENIKPSCKIVGDGPELKKYQDFVCTHGLENVTFLGLRNDMPELVREAKLTIVPSIWPEAFCNVAAESLASGVPVIASAVGGLPEVVEHNITGHLVPPGDADALASSIRVLLLDTDACERMGIAGRKKAIAQFDLSKQSEKIISLLTTSVS